jgi:hypothetical protein
MIKRVTPQNDKTYVKRYTKLLERHMDRRPKYKWAMLENIEIKYTNKIPNNLVYIWI